MRREPIGKIKRILALAIVISMCMSDQAYATDGAVMSTENEVQTADIMSTDDGIQEIDIMSSNNMDDFSEPFLNNDEKLEHDNSENLECEEELLDIMSTEEDLSESDVMSTNNKAEESPLSQEQIDEKAELASHLEEIEEAYAAGRCISNELLIYAADEPTAAAYAAQFGGTVERFEFGLAVVKIDFEESIFENIYDAILASADSESNLPPAWPNYVAVSINNETGDEVVAEYEDTEEKDDSNADDYPEDDFLGYGDMMLCADTGRVGSSASYSYSDPYLSESNDNFQWQHYLMDSKSAWKAGYIGSGVKVAILTSGVSGHNELSSLSGTNNEKKKAHYDNRLHGMVSGSAPEIDGIGTHVAGIIGAKGGNSLGGCGIAPGAELYLAGAYDSEISIPTTDSLFYSLQYAQKGWYPDIIDISICFYDYSKQIEDVINSLYNGGCAIFAPAGDDGSNQVVYPAGYSHVVSVGAVDIDNKPAYFTNSNSKVRYSGPGVDITSCSKGSTSSFVKMSGTAQASAAVAGAAAVILSSGKVTGSGAAKVNNLLSIMDKGCVKSGLGKGSVNMASSLGLSKTTSAPAAPTATAAFVCYGENYDISMYSDDGTTIYYTLDGKTPVYKNGNIVGTVYDKSKKKINIGGAAKVTLKMIAVDNKTGLVSKVATYVYDFKPNVSLVDITSENNNTTVAKGTKIKLSATVKPSFAANKNVRWDVVNNPVGVRVDKTGLVTVSKTCAVTNCTIKASAIDGSGRNDTINLTITDPSRKVSSIKPTKSSVTVTVGDGNTSSVTMAVKLTMSDKTKENLYYYSNWYSADPTVASVTKLSTTVSGIANEGSIRILGLKAGKTTIYGLANDGSGIKAKVNVTVKQYVTGLSVSGPKGDTLKIGKSATLKAKLSPEVVTNKSVRWEMTSWPSTTTKKGCGVSIGSKNGKVSAGKKAVSGKYSFVAIAKDRGTVKSTPYSLTVSGDVISKITLSSNSDRIFRVTNVKGAKTTTSFDINITGGSMDCVSVSNSNSKLVNMSQSGTKVTLSSTGHATGSANITVSTTDGSAIKKVFKIYVSNPATRLYLSLPQGRSEYVAYGASLTLKPNLLSEYGSLDSSAKKYSWSSSNPDLIAVSSKGVVTSKAEAGANTKVTITCSTTDGSNLSSTVSVVPCGKTTGFIKTPDPQNNRYRLESKCKLDGSYVGDDYLAKVNKSGLGAYVTVENKGKATEAVYLNLQGQKKGSYKVTVSKRDGSSGKISISVSVNVYKDSEGKDNYVLTLK